MIVLKSYVLNKYLLSFEWGELVIFSIPLCLLSLYMPNKDQILSAAITDSEVLLCGSYT